MESKTQMYLINDIKLVTKNFEIMKTKKTKSLMKLSLIFGVLLVILLSLSFKSSNKKNRVKSGFGIVKGKIIDESDNKPISGANVFLFNNSGLYTSQKTKGDGSFIFENIPANKYTFKAEKQGFTNYTQHNLIIEENKTISVNVSLKVVEKFELDIVEDVNTDIVSDEVEHISSTEVVDYESLKVPQTISKKRFKSKGISAMSMGNRNYCRQEQNFVPHNTEAYDKINENIFKDVVNNPLSTFSIDVDRASYSNVRRFLNGNQMPYKDAVRIEEMVNYFNYNYPKPKNGDPFSVNMEIGKCPWNENHQMALIGLQGENLKSESIPSGNMVFLLDVSGSMKSANKLPLLKKAFKILVNNLRPDDRVAIVVYAGAAGCVLESTSGQNKEKIISALDKLSAGGSTAGGAGIKLAYKIAKENFIKNGNNRVILATDGDFNVGASSDGEMVRLIEEKRKDGIYLSILGFGMGNYKDSKMEKLSNAGNGNYAYIDNIREAKKIFGEELWGTLYTIAKDVKIQIEFNPAKIKAYRLIGYENRILNKEDFNDDKKDAGDIGCGHTVTAIYEIILNDSEEIVSDVDPLEYQFIKPVRSSNLLTLKLRYKKPNQNTSNLITQKIRDEDVQKERSSENFVWAAAVAEFGMILRDSEHKANSSYQQVIALAKQACEDDENGHKKEFIKLVETAELLSKN